MREKQHKIDPDEQAEKLSSYDNTDGIKPKSIRKTVLKTGIIIVCILGLILAGAGGGFLYLRARGEKNLKTQTTETGTDRETTETEEDYITYNGKKYKYNSDIINILCLGIDKDIPIEQKRETGSEGLADAILLVSIDVEKDSIRMLAVPRDTIVPVKVQDTGGNLVGTEKMQITLQYAYGDTATDSGELMTETVSNLLYKVPIQRYCAINFQALPVLNDAIGGVRLTSIETVHWWAGSFYEGQEMHLLGQSALDYVRQRDETIPESSMGRLERQKQYVSCYIDQAKEAVKNDMTLPVTLYQQLSEHMSTNVTLEDIAYLVPEVLGMSLSMDNISMVPGDVVQGAEHEEYHVQADALKELVIQNFYEEVAEDKQTTQEEAGDKQSAQEEKTEDKQQQESGEE